MSVINPFNDPMFTPKFGTDFVNPYDAGLMANTGYMDPSLMTPAYAANMRPAYAGPTGYNRANFPEQGFFRSAYNYTAANIFGRPSSTNFYDSDIQAAAGYEITNKINDAAMWTMQNVALPIGFYYAANSLLSAPVAAKPTAMYSRAARGIAYASSTASGAWGAMTGATTWGEAVLARQAAVQAAGSTMSLGARAGQIGGGVLGRGLGGAIGGAGGAVAGAGARLLGLGTFTGTTAAGISMGASMGAAAGAGLGAAAMAFGGPLALGLAATQVADSMIISPYVDMRRGQDQFMSSTAGMSFAGRTSRGSSARFARSVGAKLQEASISYGKDGGYLAQSMGESFHMGLMDDLNLGNSNDIVNRVLEIEQTADAFKSTVAGISTTEAKQMIARLKRAGATLSQARTAASRLGMASYASGTDAQQILNTTGAQGEYIFAQSGLNGAVGNMLATSAYAGMSTAIRFGLLDPNAQARIGGAAGGAQNVAQLTAALGNSQYNQLMALYGGDGSIIDVLGRAGAAFVDNPWQASSNLALNGSTAVSNQLANNPLAAIKQYMQMAELIQGGKDGNGKVRKDFLVSMLHQNNVPPEQIISLMSQIGAMQDPRGFAHLVNAAQLSSRDATGVRIDNLGLDFTMGMFGNFFHSTVAEDMYYGPMSRMGRVYDDTMAALAVDGFSRMAMGIKDWAHKSRYGMDRRMTRGLGTVGLEDVKEGATNLGFSRVVFERNTKSKRNSMTEPIREKLDELSAWASQDARVLSDVQAVREGGRGSSEAAVRISRMMGDEYGRKIVEMLGSDELTMTGGKAIYEEDIIFQRRYDAEKAFRKVDDERLAAESKVHRKARANGKLLGKDAYYGKRNVFNNDAADWLDMHAMESNSSDLVSDLLLRYVVGEDMTAQELGMVESSRVVLARAFGLPTDFTREELIEEFSKSPSSSSLTRLDRAQGFLEKTISSFNAHSMSTEYGAYMQSKGNARQAYMNYVAQSTKVRSSNSTDILTMVQGLVADGAAMMGLHNQKGVADKIDSSNPLAGVGTTLDASAALMSQSVNTFALAVNKFASANGIVPPGGLQGNSRRVTN